MASAARARGRGVGAAAAAARLAGELGDPVTAGLFCGESGGVASDVLWNSAWVDDGERGDWPVGVAGSAGAFRGRPALASSRRFRTWVARGRDRVGSEDEHGGRQGGGGRGSGSVSRARRRTRVGRSRAWRGRHDSWRQPTVGEGWGSGYGTHQLLRLGRGQPVEEELVELELGRGEPVDVLHVDVAWGRRGTGDRGGQRRFKRRRATTFGVGRACWRGARDRRTRSLHEGQPRFAVDVHLEPRHHADDGRFQECGIASRTLGTSSTAEFEKMASSGIEKSIGKFRGFHPPSRVSTVISQE